MGIKVTILEPGGFRTGFASDPASTLPIHDEYQSVVGAAARFQAEYDGKQPGDPAKAAQVLLHIASMQHPPFRLLLGSDALKAAGQANEAHRASDDEWAELQPRYRFRTAQYGGLGYRFWATHLGEKLMATIHLHCTTTATPEQWPIDFRESDPHHRHVSHLYGLYPGTQITSSTPSLMEAAERTLTTRGDEGTGWSRAWKICMWARLRNGEHAYRLLTNLFKLSETSSAASEAGGLMPNMFCSCPPMQIDGNFGGAAGIVEMLLQSHEDAIQLLPALPEAWKDGDLRGFKARGGFEVALQWRNGKLVWAELLSTGGEECQLRYGGKKITASLKPGERRSFPELL